MYRQSISHVCRRLLQEGILKVHGHLKGVPGGNCVIRTWPVRPKTAMVAEVGTYISELQVLVERWLAEAQPNKTIDEWILDLQNIHLRAVINGKVIDVEHQWTDEDRRAHFEVILLS